jgi:membrane-associated phospholipid phosphatase
MDLWLLGGGAAVSAVSLLLLDPRKQDVPPEGLDRDEIRLDWDRNSIDDPNTSALWASDLTLLGSLAHPTVLTWTTHGSESRVSSLRNTWLIQAESIALAGGAMTLLKVATSRPRPYTYLPESERPDHHSYDVTDGDAFMSFPSGHTTMAWASSMSGMAVLAERRPDLPASVHFASGALGGGLATATALLRTEAGRHFPTDVVTGALLGSASGIGVTLLHRSPGSTHPDRGRAWKAGLLGVGAGTVIAILVTPPTSPFFD